MTGQNDRQDESLTGQVHDQAGHCPLTGRWRFWALYIQVFDFNIPPEYNYPKGFRGRFAAKTTVISEKKQKKMETTCIKKQ